MIIVPGPDVSHGILLSSFKGMLVGLFFLLGCGAARCHLYLDQNSVSVVNGPEALFLKQFDADLRAQSLREWLCSMQDWKEKKQVSAKVALNQGEKEGKKTF